MSRITLREEIAYVGSQKASVHLENRTHSSMTPARVAKGRDDLIHLLLQAHRKGWCWRRCRRKHTNIYCKSSSGEANKPPCINFKRGSCQKELACPLSVQNSKLQPDASAEASVFTNIQLNLLMTEKFLQLLQSTSQRMIIARCNYSNIRKISIERTLRMEEKARKSAGTLAQEHVQHFQRRPANNASSSLMRTSSEEVIMDSGASLHIMSKSDLALEEQETIRKTKDPSVTLLQMVRPMRQMLQQNMSMIWTRLLKFNNILQETPCEGNGNSYEWHPGQLSYLFNEKKKHRMSKNDNNIPMGVPYVQATNHRFGHQRDPSVVMTANGTAHTTGEATVYVYDLEMFVELQVLSESLVELSLGKTVGGECLLI